MITEGQKLLNKAVERDFKLETIIDTKPKSYARKKQRSEEERTDVFSKAIRKLADEKDFIHLIVATRLFGEKTVDCPIIENPESSNIVGFGEPEDISSDISTMCAKFSFRKAENLYEKATDTDNAIPYRFRNAWLERSIEILLDLIHIPEEEKKGSKKPQWDYVDNVAPAWRVYHLISMSYSKRGMSILPKGKGIAPPAKKTEAMEKALEWANYALGDNGLKMPEDKLPVQITKVQILHELNRLISMEYKALFEDFLEEIAPTIAKKSTCNALELFTLDLSNQYHSNPIYDKHILSCAVDDANDFLHPISLIKSKAALRLYESERNHNYLNDMKGHLEVMIAKLEEYEFFHAIWDDIIGLLKEMKRCSIHEWHDWALVMWEICKEKERQLGFGLQIRQHWSRLSDLYELVIDHLLEQKDPFPEHLLSAVKIIDSLKSRTPLTWSEMDAFLLNKSGKNVEMIKELRESYYIMESQIAMNIYAPDYNTNKNSLLGKFEPEKNTRLSEETIPDGWTALHLYLKNDKSDQLQCWAIAGHHDNDSGVIWKRFPSVEMTDVWAAYKEWKKKYASLISESAENPNIGVYESAGLLKNLCCEIGKKMSFLFDNFITKSSGLIFIPHGFLHLLPLHAAYDPKSKTYLFQNMLSTYLPAWSLISDDVLKSSENRKTGGSYCFRYFPKDTQDKDYYLELLNEIDWSCTEDDANENTIIKYNDIFKEMPPEWLSILCHGRADEVTPFRSVLELGERGLSFLDLQLMPLALNGTKVLLGACETELTPEKASQIDEHLSLASIFLNKGASALMGSMWECSVDLAREIQETCLSGELGVWETLQEKQKDWQTLEKIPEYWPKNLEPFNSIPEAFRLYFTAPFRSIGYPIPSKTTEGSDD